MKRSLYVLIVLISFIMILGCKESEYDITAVTGATTVALAEKAPSGINLKFKGLVKKEYTFTGDAFNAMASTRIRTREVSPEGKFLGTYIYTGVPVYNILDGIAPQKTEDAVYDRPLDIVVTFTSRTGERVHFSYGELTMTDDRHPVTLAFHRMELKPSKKPEEYEKNVFKGNINGLKLICPRDLDTERYLDDVVSVTFSVPETPDNILPKLKKGTKCSADSLSCLKNGKVRTAVYSGVKKQKAKNWVRVGHGRGYKGIANAEGYNLRSFLKKNFPGCGKNSYFMFIACDGYRVLFSGREVFITEDGDSYMLLINLNGKKPVGNNMLAPVDDYFVDRNVWGLTHIVLIDKM